MANPCKPAIPAPKRLRDGEFKITLGYTAISCLLKKKKKKDKRLLNMCAAHQALI